MTATKLLLILSMSTATITSLSQKLLDHKRIQQIVSKQVDGKLITGTVVSIKTQHERRTYAAGDLAKDQPYFIASTTKLYTTAVVLMLRQQGQLELDDKIISYLPPEITNGLHVYRGVDHSHDITIRHLLSQTSGLPDYFGDKASGNKSMQAKILSGDDQHWTFEEAIALSKTMKPLFIPGTKDKAHYSDTNFQLLGKIIEHITGQRIDVVYQQMIFEPLHLTHTYLYTNPHDAAPASLRYKRAPLAIPHAMTSFGPDGGIVSTSEESMTFVQAFFSGQLFSQSYLSELYQWNNLFFPLKYGTGIMRFKLPSFLTLFKNIPALLGHSGLSGAFAFYCPEKEMYITGTVNQIHKPGASFRMMVSILGTL